MSETVQIVLFMVGVLLAAFFSGSETALVSVRRIKLEIWEHQGKKSAKSVLAFLQRPERYLTTTLVGTNIAIVAASTIMTFLLDPYMGGFAITVISTLFLLFFGEILPKSIAREKATVFAFYATPFLRIFYILFYPLIWFVTQITRFLLKLLGMKGESVRRFFTRKDLTMLVRESEQAGLVDKEERRIISRLILRSRQKVREIMIPRTEMTVVRISDTVRQVNELFANTGHSRFPVVEGDIDTIRGMVIAKDLILEKPRSLKKVLHEILFVPESSLIGMLLTRMQETRISMAVAVDEYGGTAGLVTLEDIVEEFFGEIQDEYDEDISLFRKIAPYQIDVNARISITELNERFALRLPEGDYQTLGGLMMDTLGHIPKRHEKTEMETCTLVVLSAYRKKVNWVRILKRDHEGTPFPSKISLL